MTPWLPPEQLGALGFSIILYPSSIIFRVARATQRAALNFKAGHPLSEGELVDMDEFLDIVDMPHWQHIEDEFQGGKPE